MSKFAKITLPLLLAFLLLGGYFGFIFQAAQAGEPAPSGTSLDLSRLHPGLAKTLLAAPPDGFLPIVIEWPRTTSLVEAPDLRPDHLRRAQVISTLQAETQAGSAALMSQLLAAESNGQAQGVRAFWISPVVTLQAKPALIEALSNRTDVVQIRLDEPIYLDTFTPTQVDASQLPQNELPWGLIATHVDMTGQALGLDGSGIVVASLDTGVDWQHPALLPHYRGYRQDGLSIHFGNWHVSTTEPYIYPGDGNGHGTHTMGTLVGDDGQGIRVGIAPGATWIAVKLFTNEGATTEGWVHDAFEWIIAPEGDPTLAPDVVNNSWGSNLTSDERFLPDVQALRTAGILPIFSAGNGGPLPGTVGVPGAFPESFAVGAVDDALTPASFSSRGPSEWDEIKPDISGPGVDVLSAFPGGGYAFADGTSMAAPHVAGIAALLLQANPALSPNELESIFKSTAAPLGAPVPNNDTGKGLVNAYLAALQVSEHGHLSGVVYQAGGMGIAHPVITAVPSGGGGATSITGEISGTYSIFLAPGLYDLTASAFGYVSETVAPVEILPDLETNISFTLSPQPHGTLHGYVLDAQTGDPLSATLRVENTPLSTQTNPTNGNYSLSLPTGSWQIRVEADAHRIGHLAVKVETNQLVEKNLLLDPAPRILLVDSGRWYYNSQIGYYEEALDELDYFYQVREIRDPFGVLGIGDAPTFVEFAPYDLVIWSAPQDSPGVIQASGVITQFLSSGGSLLVSGQEIAFWDGGGNLIIPPIYFPEYFGAKFKDEGLLGSLMGIPGSPLEGIEIDLNTPDSDNQQIHPDDVIVLQPLRTMPTLQWPGGEIGGVVAGGCHPYRAAWLGFGLEGAGPREERIQTLAGLINWFAQAPAPYALSMLGPEVPLIGAPGEAISDVIQISNTGTETDTYKISLNGSAWPLSLQTPDAKFLTNGGQITIPGCSGLTLTATLTVPTGLPRNTQASFTLQLSSQANPTLESFVELHAKTPAPILIMNDWRWTDYGSLYASSLDASSLSYDMLTLDGGTLKSPRILSHYPMILWTTGEDWYSPLTLEESILVTGFLDQGGRLLMTSQDLVNHIGGSPFVRDELGVSRSSSRITLTQVLAAPENPLGELGLWDLHFPFLDLSDHIYPVLHAQPVLIDRQLGPVGILNEKGDQRTAFFSFPLEALDDDARQTLIARTLLWLSPVGESRLSAPPVSAEGTTIPVSLTVGSATTQPLADVQVELPLLPETTPAGVEGGWTYQPASHSLVWTGDLSPQEKRVFSAQLHLAADIPDGSKLSLRAFLDIRDQYVLTADADIYVDVPWITAHMQTTPDTVEPGERAEFQLVLKNIGNVSAPVILTNTLPAGSALVTGTVQASSGSPVARWGRIEWNGSLSPGEEFVLAYEEEAGLWNPFVPLVSWAEIATPVQYLGAWSALWVQAQAYFPMIGRP